MKAFIFMVTFVFVSCSSSGPEKKTMNFKKNSPEVTTTNPQLNPGVTGEMLANELGTEFVTEISFSKNSGKLSEKSRNKLRDLYRKASETGEIKEIQVVTWSESENKKLVDRRNESIENFLSNKRSKVPITAINRHDDVSFLDKVRRTPLSKINDSLDNIEDPMDKDGSIVMIFISQ